jgi:hypothetical protein
MKAVFVHSSLIQFDSVALSTDKDSTYSTCLDMSRLFNLWDDQKSKRQYQEVHLVMVSV